MQRFIYHSLYLWLWVSSKIVIHKMARLGSEIQDLASAHAIPGRRAAVRVEQPFLYQRMVQIATLLREAQSSVDLLRGHPRKHLLRHSGLPLQAEA